MWIEAADISRTLFIGRRTCSTRKLSRGLVYPLSFFLCHSSSLSLFPLSAHPVFVYVMGAHETHAVGLSRKPREKTRNYDNGGTI